MIRLRMNPEILKRIEAKVEELEVAGVDHVPDDKARAIVRSCFDGIDAFVQVEPETA